MSTDINVINIDAKGLLTSKGYFIVWNIKACRLYHIEIDHFTYRNSRDCFTLLDRFCIDQMC